MARRNDHTRQELQDIIVEEAWKIIEKDGLEGLTARKIAKIIGYAPGTIYNIFNSMEDLYLQINSKTLDLFFGHLHASNCLDKNHAPIENLKAMALCYLNFAKQYKPFWLMLFNVQVSNDRPDPKWLHDKIDQLFTPLEELLTPYFTDKEAIERKTAARVLWASVHGLCFLQETNKISIVNEESTAQDMSDLLIDTFIAGIEHKKSPAQ